MKSRWGIMLVLSLLLVAAGCTRDAGVQPFEPIAPSGDVDATPAAQPTETTLPITVDADAQNAALQTEEAVAPAADDTDAAPADAQPTETDIPVLIITDTATPVPTNTPPVPTVTPQPQNTALPSPTTLPTQADAEAMTDGTAAPAGFTPGAPSIIQPATETPIPSSTPVEPAPGLAVPTQDADLPGGEDLPEVGAEGCTYTVRAGDNAFRIAVNNNITLDELREANPELAGSNPVIQPGQTLEIPGCGRGTAAVEPPAADATPETVAGATPLPDDLVEYEVKAGDTLLAIARRYNTTIRDIADANELMNPDRLSIGQVLLIPQNSADADDAEAAPTAEPEANTGNSAAGVAAPVPTSTPVAP